MRARLAVLAFAAMLAADGLAGTRPASEGGFALGMSREAALVVAGAGASVGVLCDGIEGVMQTGPTQSAMASFANGKVTRIETTASLPPASSYAMCSAAFDAGAADVARRWGAPAAAPHDSELGLARTRTAIFKRDDASAMFVLRWFPGGTCDTALRVEVAGR
jgi:hypothetical protein